MVHYNYNILFRELRARHLSTQREAVRALRAGAMTAALSACLEGAHYELDEGFGRLRVPGLRAPDDKVDSIWWEQAGRMLLAAFADCVPSVRALLGGVVSLSIRCRLADYDLATDLSSLKHFPRLERLELQKYGHGDPLGALGEVSTLRELHLVRPTLPEGLGSLRGLSRLERLTVSELRAFGEVPALPALSALTLLDAPALSLAPLAGLTALAALSVGAVLDDDLRALSAMTSLRALTIACDRAHPLRSLAGVEPCASLDSLDVSGACIDSLAPLSGRALRSLSVARAALKSLDGPDLSSLTHLDASGTDIEHVDALGGATSLRTLDLHGCAKLRSLDGASKAAQLRTADLSGCGALRSLSALRGATRLESLALRPAERLRDLDDLAGCTALRALFLDGATRVSDLSPLKGLRALERLSLRECGAAEVIPLGALDRLVSLDLRGCEALTDVAALDALGALAVVALADTGVTLQSLPDKLAAKVTWSPDASLEGHPPMRQRVAPKGTGAHARKLIASIRKLVTSRDLEQITQGVELLRTLGDGALYDVLLDGVDWVPANGTWTDREGKSRHVGPVAGWAVTKVFDDAEPARAAQSHSLPMLLGSAPAHSARGCALRKKVREVKLLPVGDAIDLAALSGLDALRTLHLSGAATLLHPEALATLGALESLVVQNSLDPAWSEHLPPSLQDLSANAVHAARFAPGAAPSLKSLALARSPRLPLIDLSGASALESLSLTHCEGVERLLVHPNAPLERLLLNVGPHLRELSAPTARLRQVSLASVDTRPLAAFLTAATGVEELDLSYAAVPDLTPLLGMTALSILRIHGMHGVADLSPLTALPNLQQIVVRNPWERFHYPQSLRAKMTAG